MVTELSQEIEQLNLYDCWNDMHREMTWISKDNLKMSRLDRVLHNIESNKITVKTNWNIFSSDHAVVEVTFMEVERKPSNKMIIVNKMYLNTKTRRKRFMKKLNEYKNTKNPKWNPHMKLEFMKCMIRTVYEDEVKETKKLKNIELKLLAEEIDLYMEKRECTKRTDLQEDPHKLTTLKDRQLKQQTRTAKIIAEKLRQSGTMRGKNQVNISSIK